MPQEQFNFQKLYEEMERIVNSFERGELDLDKSLKEFERGLEIASLLKKKLEEVENKVEEIKEKFGIKKKEVPNEEIM